jgi:mono/diheme cytochrome c family protein
MRAREQGRPDWQLITLAVACALLAWLNRPAVTEAQDTDVLQDPVVFGAWLYEGKCVTCHGPYGQERVASTYERDDELSTAIEGGSGGCFIDWGYRNGGPLRSKDVQALIAFMRAWEALGGPPDLPALPLQPTPTSLPTPTLSSQGARASPTPPPNAELNPQVKVIIEGSELAMGAWLYTQNCHRCHLAYDVYRMGSGLATETIERNINKGKIGTTMPAFSRREGGELKAREIRAIVAYITAFEALDAPPALPEVLFTPPTPDPQDFLMIPLPQIAAVQGDALNGERLYARYCSACHGFRGEGGLGAPLARAWPSLRPDLMVRAALVAGIPGTVMPAWERRGGGDLSEEEIHDLVTYVLALPVQPPLAGEATPPTATHPRLFLYLLGGILSGAALWTVSRRAPR